MFEVVNKEFDEVIKVCETEDKANKYCFFVDSPDSSHYVREQGQSS